MNNSSFLKIYNFKAFLYWLKGVYKNINCFLHFIKISFSANIKNKKKYHNILCLIERLFCNIFK